MDEDPNVQLIDDLPERDLSSFYDLAVYELPLDEMCPLAEKLRDKSHYIRRNRPLHNRVAEQVVAEISKGNQQKRARPGWLRPAQWLEAEQDVLGDRTFTRAALDLAIWTLQDGKTYLRLSDYQTSEREYQSLLEAVWNVSLRRGVNAENFDACAFDADRRSVFLSFLAHELRRQEFSLQKFILRLIAARYGSQAVNHHGFIQTISGSEDSSDLAEYFMKLLDEHNDLGIQAERILKALVRKPFWRRF
jgi:hypothetical protein